MTDHITDAEVIQAMISNGARARIVPPKRRRSMKFDKKPRYDSRPAARHALSVLHNGLLVLMWLGIIGAVLGAAYGVVQAAVWAITTNPWTAIPIGGFLGALVVGGLIYIAD
jgi:hypothetical protein